MDLQLPEALRALGIGAKKFKLELQAQNIVGVEFAPTSIRIVKVDNKGHVLKAGRADMPDNIKTSPEPGEEYDQEKFDFALRAALRRTTHHARIGRAQCAVCLSGPDIIQRQFQMPYMESTALKLNAMHEIQAYIALSPENYYIDYKVHSFSKNEDGSIMLTVLVAAVDRRKVDRLMRILQEVGLTPVYVDILENAREKLLNYLTNGRDLSAYDPRTVIQEAEEAEAQAKAEAKKLEGAKLRAQRQGQYTVDTDAKKGASKPKAERKFGFNFGSGSGGAVSQPTVPLNAAVISFDDTFTNVTIMLNRRYYVSRHFNFGIKTLDETIAHGENVPIHQAADMRKIDNYFLDSNRRPVAEQIREIFDSLIAEVLNVIEYCYYRERKNKVDRLYITGSISAMNGLSQYLSDSFNMPVHLLDEMVLSMFSGTAHRINDASPYTNVLGAALREVSK